MPGASDPIRFPEQRGSPLGEYVVVKSVLPRTVLNFCRWEPTRKRTAVSGGGVGARCTSSNEKRNGRFWTENGRQEWSARMRGIRNAAVIDRRELDEK